MTMVKTLKKAVDWYTKKAAETNAWTPSCMTPLQSMKH